MFIKNNYLNDNLLYNLALEEKARRSSRVTLVQLERTDLQLSNRKNKNEEA